MRPRGGRRQPFGMHQMALEEMLRQRFAGGAGRGATGMSRAGSAGDVDMVARNSRMGGAGGPVPGLPGLHFSGSVAEGAAKGAASSARFHSGNINDMATHPAVAWSKSQAGIGGEGLGQSAINSLVNSRLGEQGITRDASGTWNMDFGVNDAYRQSQKGRSGPASAIPSTGITPSRTGTGMAPGSVPGGPGATRTPVPGSNGLPSSTRPITPGGPGATQVPVPPGGVPSRPPTPTSGIPGGVPPKPLPTIQGGQRLGMDPTKVPGGSPTSPTVVPPGGVPASAPRPAPLSPPPAASQPPRPMPVTQQSPQPAGMGLGAMGYMSPGAMAAMKASPTPGGPGATQVPVPPGGVPGAMGNGNPPVAVTPGRILPGTIPFTPPQQTGQTPQMPQRPSGFGQGTSGVPPTQQVVMPGNGSFQRGMANMQQAFGKAFGQTPATPAASPAAIGGSLRGTIMGALSSRSTSSQMGTVPGHISPGGTGVPGATTPAAPMRPTGGDYGPVIDQYASQFGVDPGVLHEMMMVESGGDPNAYSPNQGGSIGLMQVKPDIWEPVAQSLGLPSTYTPEGQIAMAAAILGGAPGTGGTPGDWQGNFTSLYFPADDPNSGMTQANYLARLQGAQTGSPLGSTPQTSGGYMNPNSQLGQMQQQNVAAPGTAPTGALPQGTIQTNQWGNGTDWGNLTQYDSVIQSEAAKHGIDPAYIYASMAIESGGANVPNAQGAPNRGVLQIWDGNSADAARLGYDINTTEGQIGYFAAIAAGESSIATGNTPEERIMSVYPGAGGSAQHVAEYDADWNSIVDQYHQQAGAGQPAGAYPGPGVGDVGSLGVPIINAPTQFDPTAIDPNKPFTDPAVANTNMNSPLGPQTTPVDPETGQPAQTVPGSPGVPGGNTELAPVPQTGQMNVIAAPSGGNIAARDSDESWMIEQAGGVEGAISSQYKCDANGVGCSTAGAWYSYQTGHGATAYEHAAYDIAYPSGTQLQATDYLQGTVECSGCGSYCTGGVDNNGNLYCDGVGVGEIRVQLDPGIQGGNNITMLYGHMLTSDLQPGQQVTTGTPIGQTGYAGTGAHLHQEARAYCPGMGYDQDYKYVDPTLVADGYYATHDACTE